MVITDRFKQVIFKHLYKELGDCEIIPYNGSIWFINRDNKHWYFELDKSGTLWWRYDFFNSFFKIFSMGSGDFCPVLSSWVEEVLNHKVSTTLKEKYNLRYNAPVKLVTLRHYQPEDLKKWESESILMEQKKRTTARFVIQNH